MFNDNNIDELESRVSSLEDEVQRLRQGYRPCAICRILNFIIDAAVLCGAIGIMILLALLFVGLLVGFIFFAWSHLKGAIL